MEEKDSSLSTPTPLLPSTTTTTPFVPSPTSAMEDKGSPLSVATPTPLLPSSTTPSIPSPTSAKPKNILGPLVIFSYLLSLPVLAAGVWLLCMRDYECEDLLRMPKLRVLIGIGMILLFSISNTVVFYGPRILMSGLLVMLVPLIVMLTVGLALVGAYRMESRAVPGSPMWLRLRLSQTETWYNVQCCIYDSGVCSDLGFRTIELTSYDFSMQKLSPIESGCCRPPVLCEMEYVNATFWNAATKKNDDDSTTVANSESYASFGDCNNWSNDNRELCYNCHSCKVGFLETIEHRWRQLGVFLVLMSVLFLVVHVLRFVVTMWKRYKM